MNIITGDHSTQHKENTMTTEYREEPPQLLIIVDEPHPLEEKINAAAEDGDNDTIIKIYVNLYREGRIEEIENILMRYLLTPKQISTALERIRRESEVIGVDRN